MYQLTDITNKFVALISLILLSGCGGGDSETGGSGGGSGTQSHIVSAIAGAGGTISPASRTVANGQTTTFTVSANTGYSISSVSGCGGVISGNIYTTGAVTSPCTINAIFNLNLPTTVNLEFLTQSIKSFIFKWEDVSGETEYRLLENVDGNSAYEEIAVINANSTEYNLTVFLPERINASYILAACNTSGCTDSSPVYVNSSLASAIGYFKSSASGENSFGDSLVLSGDAKTLAVGAPAESSHATGINGDESDKSAPMSGAVYIFIQEGALWKQQAYIKASNTDANDSFGSSLDLSADGNTLAVGAQYEDGNSKGLNGNEVDNSEENSGAVYIFSRTGMTWNKQAYIKGNNTQAGDRFGAAISLAGDGNTLIVGAPNEDSNTVGVNGNGDDNSANSSGAVYVFARDSSFWNQSAFLKASNTEINDGFGRSVSLSLDGKTLAVGATGEDSAATGVNGDQTDNISSNSGAIYLFSYNDLGWSQQAYIKASNTEIADGFGFNCALSDNGNTLAVSASGEDSRAAGVNGDQSDNSATSSGAVYVFFRENNVWNQQAYIKASNTEANDYFGSGLVGSNISLSSDGNKLAVGAWAEGSNAIGINGDETDNSADFSGAVYLFSRLGNSWTQLAYIKAPNTNQGDFFGGSLAFSSDATVLAVGAVGESSESTGINGNQNNNSLLGSGAVYLY